jgi:hypothetical protein
VILLLLLLQSPLVDVHGKLGLIYTREADPGDSPLTDFRLHYGIIDLTLNVRDDLKVFYSNDLGIVRRFYADFSVPRLNSSVNAGKFSIPFGLRIPDHTSLLEDNMQLGLSREKTGVALSLERFCVNISGGVFPATGINLYAGTVSMKRWLFDGGVAYLLGECTDKNGSVDRKYYEFYARMSVSHRLSLLGKCVMGNRRSKDVLGSAVVLELPLHPICSPFVQYESFDPDQAIEKNGYSRIVTGIACTAIPNVALRFAYYVNHEQSSEIDNDLLSVMFTVWW